MKNTNNIVKHRTLKESEGVSLSIARFVQYFNDSFGVRNSFAAHSDWAFNIESKSSKILLISVAVSHIEIPLSKTKSRAEIDESKM
tara:strand:+ start:2199 stop:2456 length:258 start_codon:yes stop_codon:yes gene_type:complete